MPIFPKKETKTQFDAIAASKFQEQSKKETIK